MKLFTSILLLIVTSRVLGQLMSRIKQPRIMGEILAGFLLGPSLLGVVESSKELEGIAELSMFLIVLSAGLEMEFKDVINSVRGRGGIAALLDFLVPLGAGLVVGTLFHFDAQRSVFIGLCMSITALPVAIRILDDFKMLNSSIARYSIATSILNDVAALLFLGVLLTAPEGGKSPDVVTVVLSLAKTALKMLIFAFLVALANRLLRWGGAQANHIERLLEKILDFFGRDALFGIAALFVLVFGSMSENLGSHFVIGAFFGGLLLSRDVLGSSLFSELEHTINSITGGFLGPIFFATLGLRFGLNDVQGQVWLVVAILAASVISKLAAGYLGARWIKMSHREALGVGIILNGRGIMELIVANIAYQKGIIEQDLFSILILMGLFTTFITPPLFRRLVYEKLTPIPLEKPA